MAFLALLPSGPLPPALPVRKSSHAPPGMSFLRPSPPSDLTPSTFFNPRKLKFLARAAQDLNAQPHLSLEIVKVSSTEVEMRGSISKYHDEALKDLSFNDETESHSSLSLRFSAFPCGVMSWLGFTQLAQSSEGVKIDMVYEIGELFELGIQLSYLLILLGLLGAGTFFVIRQVLVRRELDLSAKELQEQVRSGDATATECFELGAVMLRRKFYPAATKYLLQAIEKWDRDDQDLAQVYNALGVSYVRDNKLDKGIMMFEKAVKLQPGYVTAWNNLGDAYERKKDLRAALRAFEEVLLFDPNNKVARPRRDALRERVQMYKGVSIKSEDR
ncbi:uncharacterized protein LOC109728697 isoform X2 [Ananas comosus]|uniref:Uncharacterized protein LOC109728697 isoform X2 n=1 Tax=Ananas comosus TaxID=4615 RepID=A0A199UN56_ANACO|nr:uncharacterized protein LOC109728697 isoform X2 [Ananas comosus]OAY66060.1 Uncharacterized protein ycf37 [Ananas comosus]